MRLSKPAAVLVLIATAIPLVYLVLFMASILVAVLAESIPFGGWFEIVFVLHVLCILWIWGLTAFYLIFLFKTEVVPSEQKALWAVVLFLGNILAMPVFWYLYIWRPLRRAHGSQSTAADQSAPDWPRD